MRVLSIEVPILKKSGNLFNDPRIYKTEFGIIVIIEYPTYELIRQK